MWFKFFFFKQKTAYEMRISDWSSDVCSSDLPVPHLLRLRRALDIGEIIAVEDLEGLIAALERRDRIGADDLAAGIVEIDLVLDPGVGAAPHDVMFVLPDDLPLDRNKIGRASGRERVWHYL